MPLCIFQEGIPETSDQIITMTAHSARQFLRPVSVLRGQECNVIGKVCDIMAKEFKLSPERLKELQDELVYLKTVREKEVAELIKEARSFGDLSENSEYDEAKTEQGKLYSRIAEVENILSNYVVIEENEGEDGNFIRLGSTVTVLDKEFDEELTYKIVGSQEADPMNGAISEDSPFGKALMGRNEGEDVTVDAPAGPVEYKILKVER